MSLFNNSICYGVRIFKSLKVMHFKLIKFSWQTKAF